MNTDIDVVGEIEKLIRKNDGATLGKIAPEIRGLLNRRNCGIFWRVLIDSAGALADRKASGFYKGDPMAAIKALEKGGLSPNQDIDSGRRPIFEAIERSPRLARLFAEEIGSLDPNVLDKQERTPLMIAASGAHDPSGANAMLVSALLRGGRIDLGLKDQGALALFESLSRLPLRAEQPDAAEIEARVLEDFVRAGVDINAPRGRTDLFDPVQINTPLSFFLKKLANFGAARRPGWKESAERIVEKLLDLGADPTLQLEKTERLAIMRVCEQAGFSDGLAQRLERKAIADHLFGGEAEPPRKSGRKSL